MIVDSMTHAEVYQELAKEREAVSTWWKHKLHEQRRLALKSTSFPLKLWYEHISPRKNRYLFITCILDKRMKRVMTGVIVPRYTAEGLMVYNSWLSSQKGASQLVFTPHMLKRYSERCNVQKSGIELVKHFLSRNPHGKLNHNERLMPRSVRYNGEEHKASCVQDGVLLGQVTDGIFIMRTFITYDMCNGRQQQEFEAGREKLIGISEMHDLLTEYYY